MSPGKWIYSFGDGSSQGDPERKDLLGGKGASLAAMSRAGLPVPPGFTLSVDCCRWYYEHGRTWPKGMAEELREHLARLESLTGRRYGQGRQPLLVSVRSGAAVSMPGMMDTLLNCGLGPALAGQTDDAERFWRAYAQFIMQFGATVGGISLEQFQAASRGSDAAAPPWKERAQTCRRLYEQATGRPFPIEPWQALVECVNAVFDSWNNERAVVYRRSQGISGLHGTAVNVQAMFPSEVSGIAFTANPADPSAEEAVIESAYGLGEAVVSGMVTPDLFVVDRRTLAVKSRTLGSKGLSLISLDGSGRRESADPSAFSLSDEEVRRVAELALNVEDHFGFAVDMEWGLHEGELALLQSRPVAGLEVAKDIEVGRREEIDRLKAMAQGRRKVWIAHNLVETLPAPTPLTWDIIRQFMTGGGGFGRMYRDLGYQPSRRVREHGFLELICGRVYADPERAAEMFWPDLPQSYDLDALVRDPGLIQQAPSRFDAHRANGTFLLRLPRVMWSAARCWRRMRRARAAALEVFHQQALPAYLSYVQAQRQQDQAHLPTSKVIEQLHDRIQRVLDDFAPESLKPGFFGGLARAQLEGSLIRLMGPKPARELCALLTCGLSGDTTVQQSIMLFQVARGQARLEDFLREYGHRGVGEMELAVPRWREDTACLNRMIEEAGRHDSPRPQQLHAANEALRLAAQRGLGERLAEWGGSCMREHIEALQKEAQTLLPYREIGKHYLMMGYELIRLTILALARRWQLGGDVFFLHLDELERFEAQRDGFAALIARRRIRWQSARRLLLEDVVDSTRLNRLGLGHPVAASRELSGLPLAPGVVEGTVAIVSAADQIGKLPDDCILVCPSTDPGWTALFPSIRGLLVEHGGVLSHGAITARDFGIPAVACPHATGLLRAARRVRLDGGAGTVTVLDEA